MVAHPLVAEAAVVGFPHEIKGEGICCFVIPKGEIPAEEAKKELIAHVRKQIGALATPDQIRFTPALPRPAAAKSCGACSAISQPAANRRGTPRRWKTCRSWPSCVRMMSSRESETTPRGSNPWA